MKRMEMRIKVAITFLLLIFLAVIGCSGSGNGDQTATESKTSSTAKEEPGIDSTGAIIIENLTRDELEDVYDQIVLAKAPPFNVYDLRQNKITLDDFKDYVVLVNFWSMESPVSKRLFPVLSEIQNEFRDSSFLVLGVCTDRKELDQIEEAADFNKLSYPVVFPGSTQMYTDYDVPAPGKSVIIDRNGNIVGEFFDNPGLEKLKKVISLFL
jgi:thiol-disulfide isomerase/thioredoxin